MIGKIDRVPLREVWAHEAQDFTTWLQENTDVLNDALDLSLSSAESEQAAGDFSVDIVAEDEAGNPVIIENQLEKSDHNHLGKLITYLTALEARAAVWMVADPRPEHVGAIAWLNESTAASFYLVKVEAVKIGDSDPAPLLTLIVGPSEETEAVGVKKKELSERHVLRKRFWAGLLEHAKEQTELHAGRSATNYNWIGTGAGKRGLGLNYVVRRDGADVELYIDRGKEAKEENAALFDALAASKDEIDGAFGEPLQWERLEGKRACRIRHSIAVGGYRDDEARWPEIHDAMIDAMIRLEKALRPHIDALEV
jgi:hypothetical protein